MKNIKVVLIGFGTVCSALYKQLSKNERFHVERIVVRDRYKPRQWGNLPIAEEGEWLPILEDPSIHVILEAIDDADAAYAYAQSALRAGKIYITANKRMLAYHLQTLLSTAKLRGGSIYYEAAVGGAIPIVRTLDQHYKGQSIRSLRGILNGSCNYILTRMEEEDLSFDLALKEAQEKGFAESDPTLDIEGYDAMYKTVLLAWSAFNQHLTLSDVQRTGIDAISVPHIRQARKLGARVRLIATIENKKKKLTSWVRPEWLWPEDPLFAIQYETNAIEISGEYFGTIMLQGPGAGGDATASAMIGDLYNSNILRVRKKSKTTSRKLAGKTILF